MPRPTARCHTKRGRRCAGACVRTPTGGCRQRTPCAEISNPALLAPAADATACATAGCEWRRWNRRAQRLDCYPRLPFPRRIVSYSLFWGPARGAGHGGRCHPLSEYRLGLWMALRAAQQTGWDQGGGRPSDGGVHVYHDGTVDRALLDAKKSSVRGAGSGSLPSTGSVQCVALHPAGHHTLQGPSPRRVSVPSSCSAIWITRWIRLDSESGLAA